MTTALAPISQQLEQVLVGGDLSKLTAPDRVMYYKAVCESVGLNPLTKPFEYITLNGKLTLYARRDATDQLRQINSVSIEIKAREVVEDCYIVTACARNGQRQDESIGAVNIKGLTGEARANAMMKAETKAKRRVTLSICGLGMLDETEVETIPDAKRITPTAGAADRVSAERQGVLTELADKVKGWMAEGSLTDAFMELDNAGLDADEKVYLWTMFDAPLRRQLKEEGERMRVRNAAKAVAAPAEPVASVISDAQRKRLEARIVERVLERDYVKAKCRLLFGKEHFAELEKEEYKQLDEWLDEAIPVELEPVPRPAPLSQPSVSPSDATQGEGAGLDVPLLSFEQSMSLTELLEEKLIPTARFLAAAEKVTNDVYLSISQMPADFYDRGVKWIEAQKSNRPARSAQ